MDLQSVQESKQILPFLRGEVDVESLVVELDHIAQRRCRPVVKIRSAGRESAQNRPFDLTDIFPQSGNERASGVGGYLDFMRNLILKGEDGQVANVERARQV